MATKTRKSRTPKKVPQAPLPTDNITNRRIGDVRADVRTYVRCKTAAGNQSLHNGDQVARKLVGKELPDIYKIAAETTGLAINDLKTRYSHLNPGMQRMNLGNLIRGAL